jgi:hypothetical protein
VPSVVAGLLFAAAAAIGIALVLGGRRVWSLRSASVSDIRTWAGTSTSPSPAQVRLWLTLEIVFAVIAAVALLAIASRAKRSGLARFATLVFALWSIVGTAAAWNRLLRGARSITLSDTVYLRWFASVRLLLLVAAALAVVQGFGQRLKRPDSLPSTYLRARARRTMARLLARPAPAVAPPAPNESPTTTNWTADDTRFAIAVSGGGIRSASFALGALQELRSAGVLAKARWMTAVSGGSYVASALTILNQVNEGDTVPSSTEPLAPGSPEERHLRSHLRYLVSDSATVVSSVFRIVIGLLFNLVLLYLVLFATLRPVGWVVGHPLVQRDLRVEGIVGWSVLSSTNDPDVVALGPRAQPPMRCGLGGDTRATQIRSARRLEPSATSAPSDGLTDSEPGTLRFEVALQLPEQCVVVSDSASGATYRRRVVLSAVRPAVVALQGAALRVERQPHVVVAASSCVGGCERLGADSSGNAGIRRLFRVSQPSLELVSSEAGVTAGAVTARADTVLRVTKPATLSVVPAMSLRGGTDVDGRHWVPAGVLLTIAVLGLFLRSTWRPSWFGLLNAVATCCGVAGLAWGLMFLVLPWFVAEQPAFLMRLGTVGPSVDSLAKFELLGLPRNAPPLLAWLVLSVAAIRRFLLARTAKSSSTAKRGARNAPRRSATSSSEASWVWCSWASRWSTPSTSLRSAR